MNAKTAFGLPILYTMVASCAYVMVAACAGPSSQPDHPTGAEFVRPDGKIYAPPPSAADLPPAASAQATPTMTDAGAAPRVGVIDSIHYVRPRVDNPDAIPGGPDMMQNDAPAANPLSGNAQATREIAKEREQERERYQIRVRLPDGSYRTVFRENVDGLKVGDQIRVGAEGAPPN